MGNKSLRIVFMGTPDFAVASLNALLHSNHKILAVVTAPDKQAGRGRKLSISAVKRYASKNNLPVMQARNLKDTDFINHLQAFDADLFVVVAFRMLPAAVWKIPPLGTVNLHASLLPQYRGAAPINWAIINGENQTGLTTFFINENIDTGKICKQTELTIDPQDTAGSLHDKMKILGGLLLVETLDELAADKITPIDQIQLKREQSALKTAPKIFKKDCLIRWSRKSNDVFNHIRGLSPCPAAYTLFELEKKGHVHTKILKAAIGEIIGSHLKSGSIDTDNKTYLRVAANDRYIEILELQAAGKRVMKITDFMRGNNLK